MTEVLSVSPSGPLQVGFSDTVEFDILLTDNKGNAIADEPIDAAFIDQSHNAELAPARLITDSSGRGTVLFTAPAPVQEDTISFEIRFKSADTESFVEVSVDPALVAVTFEVKYSGNRELSELEATLYKLDTETETRTEVNTITEKAQMPATLTFSGLLRNGTYEVELNGRNASDEIRASGNLSDLTPNTDGLILVLEDTRLNLIGQYIASAEISTDKALDWAVDELINASDFVQSTASAILDGIKTELASDPFAADTFAAQREENDLDAVLKAHLQDQDVDVSGVFESIGQSAKLSLDRILAEGTIEIGKNDGGDIVAYHSIEQLSFGLLNPVIGPVFLAEVQDAAICSTSYGPDDTLVISAHDIGIGLGSPIGILFEDVCTNVFGSSDITRALQSLVDCAEVATFLEPLLSDVAVRQTIELGCLSAIETAEEAMDAKITDLNQTNRLSFAEGTCTLEIPLSGNQVQGFFGESFSVTWHKDQIDADAMNATVTASITESR